MPVSSPCTKLCLLDPVSGLCEGCGRTADEIARWSAIGEAERLAIMAGLPERLRRLREGLQPAPRRGRA